MNAGAYGREVKDILIEARLVLRDGTIETWPLERFGYTYRHSEVPPAPWSSRRCSKGQPGDREAIGAEMDRIAASAKPRSRFEAAPAARPSRTRRATKPGR
jgi:UDP-N-acetylmuramate dehydrogenase